MATVTISRQMGSFGAKVARLAAKQLGYAVADKDTIEKVFRQYGLTRLGDLYAKAPSFWELLNYDSMLTISMLNEVEQALAKRGNVVIIGRSGYRVLEGLADAVHVRVEAPEELRAERVAERDDIALAVARTRVQADDVAREKFVKLFYNSDVSDPKDYDLDLDTSKLSVEDAAAQIVAHVRALSPAAGAPLASELEVDPVLAESATRALG